MILHKNITGTVKKADGTSATVSGYLEPERRPRRSLPIDETVMRGTWNLMIDTEDLAHFEIEGAFVSGSKRFRVAFVPELFQAGGLAVLTDHVSITLESL